jgi:hypothetical protein
MSTPEQRAAWIAGMRKLLDILEADPSLRLPEAGERQGVTFFLYASMNERKDMAALEAAIPVPFTAAIPDPDKPMPEYILTGDMDGLTVVIKSYANYVAERHVIGTRTVEDVEWVRLPAVDDEAETPEGPAES